MKVFKVLPRALVIAALFALAACSNSSDSTPTPTPTPTPKPTTPPTGFVTVAGSTVAGGDKFKVGNNAGVFVSGRSVAISTFWMCDHEVTQAEYKAVMETNPSNWTGDDLPVEKVSWYDAIYYCNKKSLNEGLAACYAVGGKDDPSQWGYTPHAGNSISGTITCDFSKNGYRLPTEAEWEYAARGGKAGCEAANPTDWAGTDSSSELRKYAWYKSNSGDKTHAVKTEKQAGVNSANSLGLYDMIGNVWDWCWDWYDDTSAPSITASTPASGASSGSDRVDRGGSWQSGDDYCLVAYRGSLSPSDRFDNLGFRVVRSAQ